VRLDERNVLEAHGRKAPEGEQIWALIMGVLFCAHGGFTLPHLVCSYRRRVGLLGIRHLDDLSLEDEHTVASPCANGVPHGRRR
jgi:hypothetical protein